MTYAVRVRPGAESDVGRAALWYATHAPEQVGAFIDEFDAALARIVEFPLASRPLSKGCRATHFAVFPYQIWFRIDDAQGEIEVLALVHDRQHRGGFAPRLT